MYSNIMEDYYECLIVNKDKINEIEEIFNDLKFVTTFKNESRIALIRENIYFEYYKDEDDGRYNFNLIMENDECKLYTYEFSKIDNKLNQFINKIKKEKQ